MATDESPRENPFESPSLKDSLTSPGDKVYSVPRRFDLATMFAVSFAFAVMFGVFRLMQMPAEGTVVISAFIAVVGFSQAMLFKGKRPRLASLLVGAIAYSLAYLIAQAILAARIPSLIELFFMCVLGCLFGYLAGCLVGTVFYGCRLLPAAGQAELK